MEQCKSSMRLDQNLPQIWVEVSSAWKWQLKLLVAKSKVQRNWVVLQSGVCRVAIRVRQTSLGKSWRVFHGDMFQVQHAWPHCVESWFKLVVPNCSYVFTWQSAGKPKDGTMCVKVNGGLTDWWHVGKIQWFLCGKKTTGWEGAAGVLACLLSLFVVVCRIILPKVAGHGVGVVWWWWLKRLSYLAWLRP